MTALGPLCGVIAAALFGMSAPLGKLLLVQGGPFALAGVFYLSAGVALSVVASVRPPTAETPLRARDLPLLAAVALLGGVAGPVLMLYGLSQVSGVTGALLLNLEAPATMLLAVSAFREHLSRRETVAAAFVVLGAACLGVEQGSGPELATPVGVLALAGACVAWGLDNNLTQRLSLRDPVALVRWKALAAGACSLVLALGFDEPFPHGRGLVAAVVVGVLSYGVSIVLDAYALRLVGAAREAAFFATAPFFGALVAMLLFGELPTRVQLASAAAMALGAWLLIRARHGHAHAHEAITHEHVHTHDAHHVHDHAPGVGTGDPHSHVHTHAALTHDHPHLSDAHHRHGH